MSKQRTSSNKEFGDMPCLVFERMQMVIAPERYAANAQGLCLGSHIVAYPCDEDGRVLDWQQRYEVEGHDYGFALKKLYFLIANGMIEPLQVDAGSALDDETEARLNALLCEVHES